MVTQEAGSLHRTAGTQPGVYFTLDAPFARIIGLFSNSLEDPGVISSEGGKWPVSNIQLDYLRAQLQRIIDENYLGAVLFASHHPPFAYSPETASSSAHHSSSFGMLAEIDSICAEIGVFPHAYLSGHAHNYQRFVRTLTVGGNNIQIPYFIVGNSGHNVNPIVQGRRGQPAQKPQFGDDASYLDVSNEVTRVGLTIDEYDDQKFGYMTVTVDKKKLTVTYNQVQGDGSVKFSPIMVDLARRTVSK